MKKCKGCERELDKYAIICWYCGKLSELQKAYEKKKEELLEKNDKKEK